MRRPRNFYDISRPKLRASWNKYNLYNIARGAGKEPPIRGTPTFFQQKWAAKAKTRAYHGEHIREKEWKRTFSHRLQAAVDMPAEYLAANDGSEQASGRGQGLAHVKVDATSYSKVPKPSTREQKLSISRITQAFADPNALLAEPHSNMTPHAQMVYAPLERRLDTAVFRALFASSVRQARQFIVHGAVKVNGKKMVHPMYQLNPGDMFQVEVEKVLFAAGAPKKSKEELKLEERLKRQAEHMERFKEQALARDAERKVSGKNKEGEEGEEGAAATAPEGETAESASDELSPEESWRLANRNLKFVLKEVKKLLKSDPRDLTATQKRQLRLFKTNAKHFLARPEDSELDSQNLLRELQLQMKTHELMRETFEKFTFNEEVPAEGEAAEEGAKEASGEASQEATKEKTTHNRTRQITKALAELTEEQKEKAMRIMGDTQLSRDEMRKLGQLLKNDEENPYDESKPYATPWRPRPFLAPFAFVPRYLEVNPNICAAVYLRHPVARKGLAEVPTPFSYLTNQLTHNYYVERGQRTRTRV